MIVYMFVRLCMFVCLYDCLPVFCLPGILFGGMSDLLYVCVFGCVRFCHLVFFGRCCVLGCCPLVCLWLCGCVAVGLFVPVDMWLCVAVCVDVWLWSIVGLWLCGCLSVWLCV